MEEKIKSISKKKASQKEWAIMFWVFIFLSSSFSKGGGIGTDLIGTIFIFLSFLCAFYWWKEKRKNKKRIKNK